MKTTTELSVIRDYPKRFTWGRITTIHDVGPYTLVEYLTPAPEEKTNFHVYVEGRDTHTGAPTLEGALITAIARKNLESNLAHYMARGAAKLLGVPNS